MKSVLLATLALTLAAPIDLDQQSGATALSAPTQAVNGLTPLVSVAEDGSLWIGEDAKERLLGTSVQELAQRHFAKRGLQTTEHFCFGGGRRHHDRYPLREPGCEPFEPPLPPPPPPRVPCEGPPPAPCDRHGEPCDDPCIDELRASCYTKWFCPSTYCCDGENLCPEEPYYGPLCYSRHPVVDGLRRNCLTKWFCPSTYCPSNWCCDDNGCLDGGCYEGGCWGGPCGEPEFGCEPNQWDEPSHWDEPAPFPPRFEPVPEPCFI